MVPSIQEILDELSLIPDVHIEPLESGWEITRNNTLLAVDPKNPTDEFLNFYIDLCSK